MLRTGAVSLMIVGMLSACGHTPQERAASGALIGGAIGAVVGLANEPHHDGYYEPERRRYGRSHRRHHRDGGWRRERDWEYYDDDCCYN
ncbi:MAG: hypothetical protein ACR2RA_15985 [Geminicoccaceae bacterium]